jgi:HlyD family secretion protein
MSRQDKKGPRESAIERSFSPDNLNQLMTVVSARDWIPLLGIAFLFTAGIVWCFLGSLPTSVVGRGVLERSRQVVTLEASTGGRLEWLRPRPGDLVQKGEVIGALDRNSGKIASGYSGRVAELYAATGQDVAPGAHLLLLDVEGPGSSIISVSYFPIKDAAKIQPGMTIQVTPDTVERSRFGGIVGTIVSVLPLPMTKEATLGSMVPGEWMEVTSQLESDPSTPSGYRWSSSRGPRIKISPGIASTAHVTIARRAPIDYVFPSLRDASDLY